VPRYAFEHHAGKHILGLIQAAVVSLAAAIGQALASVGAPPGAKQTPKVEFKAQAPHFMLPPKRIGLEL
jgi:hypothetical protein